MNSVFTTPATQRLTAKVALAIATIITSAFSVSCKTLRSNSAVRSSIEQINDETLLPDYEPRFLDVDAGAPAYANSDSEVTPITPPKDVTSGFALVNPKSKTSDDARYFFSLYAWQGVGPFNLPAYTHVFGVFARVDGRNLASDPLHYFTISWDAADGDIAMKYPPKAGHNYSLQETFRLREKMKVTTEVRRSRMAEITKNLYDAAYAHYTRLSVGESTGIVLYKMMDDMDGRHRVRSFTTGAYSNCQHAISDIVSRADGTLLETGFARGFSAGDKTYEWLTPYHISVDPSLEVVARRMLLQNPNN